MSASVISFFPANGDPPPPSVDGLRASAGTFPAAPAAGINDIDIDAVAIANANVNVNASESDMKNHTLGWNLTSSNNNPFEISKYSFLSSARAAEHSIQNGNLSVSTAPREPIRFEFEGVSIWLELEEYDDGDISRILGEAGRTLGLLPIPQGHVTAIYGINHIDESEVRARFKKYVTLDRFGSWPCLSPVGVLVDVEVNGVNGGLMDMAWSEITLSSSMEHESYIDRLYEIFLEADGILPRDKGENAWRPHLSIAYDNPEQTVLNLNNTVEMIARNPTLVTMGPRSIAAISLWSTKGKMTDWVCLERLVLK